jgi:hypothetical protein
MYVNIEIDDCTTWMLQAKGKRAGADWTQR